MNLWIVGRMGMDEKGKERGQLAKSFLEGSSKYPELGLKTTLMGGPPFFEDVPDETVVVYTGSGSTWAETVTECERLKLPLILASTSVTVPTTCKTHLVNAPNLALGAVIAFRAARALKLFKEQGGETAVIEAHRPAKTSPPGTALKLADLIGHPKEHIVSIRSGAASRALLGIHSDNVDSHGVHVLFFALHGFEVKLELKANDREPYLFGLAEIAKKLLSARRTLSMGVHSVEEVMWDGDTYA